MAFTPGNHDAFDWSVTINGPDLFREQLEFMDQAGIEVVAGNFKGVNPEIESILKSSLILHGQRLPTRLFGLTLANLFNKSNINEDSVAHVFTSIAPYEESFASILAEMKESGVKRAIFGVHEGHVKLEKKINVFKSMAQDLEMDIKVPLVMGAHDHQTVSYLSQDSRMLSGGSHGSFNFVRLTAQGLVDESSIVNIRAPNQEGREVNWERFQQGQVVENDLSREDIRQIPWLREFDTRLESLIAEKSRRLMKTLVELRYGVLETRSVLKTGLSRTGSLVADSLARWGQDILGDVDTTVIAMTNSSSYRHDDPLYAGPLSELTIRQMYPFQNEASLYELDGRTIEQLFIALRQFYSQSDSKLYSPQLNSVVRESYEGGLQILTGKGVWENLVADKKYYLVIDGWLSDHRFGQSYRLESWLEEFRSQEPLAHFSHQEILVRYFPQVVHELESDGFEERVRFCRKIF